MNILRVMGCSTKSAAEMPPTHARASVRRCGRSLTNATQRAHTMSGAHNHSWKLKLNSHTATADTNATAPHCALDNALPCLAKSSPAANGSMPPMKL